MTTKANAGNSGLGEQRRAVGISQQELARRAGCSISIVGLLERGYRPSQSDVLERVLAVLNANEPAGNQLEAKTTRDAGARYDGG
jgi:transcriptional regulator with XRE-family HTH domain